MASGRLTTHVLDTAHGVPAAELRFSLSRVAGGANATTFVLRTQTNADGRCNAPLLDATAMAVGTYVLAFEAGEYFRRRGVILPDPPFLDTVEIRFGIADPDAHYHVPLLISPFGYSTYRGS